MYGAGGQLLERVLLRLSHDDPAVLNRELAHSVASVAGHEPRDTPQLPGPTRTRPRHSPRRWSGDQGELLAALRDERRRGCVRSIHRPRCEPTDPGVLASWRSAVRQHYRSDPVHGALRADDRRRCPAAVDALRPRVDGLCRSGADGAASGSVLVLCFAAFGGVKARPYGAASVSASIGLHVQDLCGRTSEIHCRNPLAKPAGDGNESGDGHESGKREGWSGSSAVHPCPVSVTIE
jgi:hypothetical protein